MDEAAKLELEQKVSLFQFYMGSYIKGIAFFLAITGALLKFAIDSSTYRVVFFTAGAICNVVILIPLIYAYKHEGILRRDFIRLARATETQPISTSPLRMLTIATTFFWMVINSGWVYIGYVLK